MAGGRSRRMGRDKSELRWAGTTLLDHALARLRSACTDVRILSGAERRYEDRGAPLVLDDVPDQGPLGGILAGLRSCPGRNGLFLAVDLPAVTVALLQHLVDLAGSHDAIVPESPRGYEPLCAVYGPTCVGPIARCLEVGERRMTGFWPDVRVGRVSPDALRAFGDPERLFLNLNSPEDLPGQRGRATMNV